MKSEVVNEVEKVEKVEIGSARQRRFWKILDPLPGRIADSLRCRSHFDGVQPIVSRHHQWHRDGPGGRNGCRCTGASNR